MRVIVWLAIRGLVATPRTLALLVVAVGIGVGFQIPNTANLAGSSATLVEEWLTGGLGDVRVEPRGRSRFGASEPIEDQIERVVPGARATRILVVSGAVAHDRSRFFGTPVLAVDFATSSVRLAAGRAPAAGELAVVLGSVLARDVGARIGDEIEVRLVLDDATSDVAEGGAYTMPLTAIAGSAAAARIAMIDRGFLSGELGDPGSASTVLVHLRDHDRATDTARAIEAAIPGVRALDWPTDVPFLPRVLAANRVIERISLAMVVAAISVPLLALMYVAVLRQRRDDALLRSLGFSRRHVFLIYLVQSLFVGCLGSVLGAAIGAVANHVFERYPVFTWETMVVRPLTTPATFAVPIAVGLGTSVVAGLIAAWRAVRSEPAPVLRQLD